MIVIDASLAFEILSLTEKGRRHAEAASAQALHAPHLFDVEILNVTRRAALSGQASAHQAAAIIDTLQGWRITRHAHTELLQRAWILRDSVSAFDALYVALAELLGAPLWTCDGRLARSLGHQAEIVLL